MTYCSVCQQTKITSITASTGICRVCDGTHRRNQIRASNKYNSTHPDNHKRDPEKVREYKKRYYETKYKPICELKYEMKQFLRILL